jgi:hypothetical protein
MANGKNGRLKKLLGMRQHPTTAGQARFGDVDVTGAQTTARERGRMDERLGAAAGAGLRDLVGAQVTERERQRVRNLTGAQMTEAERRRLVRGGR